MADNKMLQMLLGGQRLIRQDIKRVETKLEKKIDDNTTRIDKLGVQIAELEDR